MNLLLIHVHEFSPFPSVSLMEAALHFPELSCTLQHAPFCPHYTEISHHASVWCNFRFDSFSASRKRNEERWQCSWSETIDEPHHMLIRFACKCIFFNIPRDGLVSMLFMSSLSLVSTLNNHSSSFSLENLQPQRKKKSIENAVVSHNLFICS